MKFNKSIFGLILMLGIFGQMAVSCYDDSALWDESQALREELEKLEHRIDSLQQHLNDELQALEDMIEGKVTISECVANEDGSYIVILSSGVSFTIYPKAEQLKSVISYVEQGGVKYWAVINENGGLTVLTDKDGRRIPVETVTPKVVTIDGENYLVIGDQQYPLSSGNSVFSDYEVIVDEASGEVLAVTFTFGEDMTFTVTVDGSSGLRFMQVENGELVPLRSVYVSPGATSRVLVEVIGVDDYIAQLPSGWKLKDVTDGSDRYFEISAPQSHLVESGYAEADGELKIVAVLTGGKSVISKLQLSSSEPFAEFKVLFDSALISPNYGVEKFVYGVSDAASFDEEAVRALAAKALADETASVDGYAVGSSEVSSTLADIYSGISVGSSYVLWAVVANKDVDGYTAEGGAVVKLEFRYVPVSLSVSDVTFCGATLSFEVTGLTSYYAGVAEATETVYDEILASLNGGTAVPQTEMSYNGPALAFAGSELTAQPGTKYVVWYARPSANGVYVFSDLLICEFTTSEIVSGGSVNVVAGTETASPRNVLVPLTATGANGIYYGFLTPTNAGRYPDDASLAKYLLDSGTYVEGAEATASAEALKLKPTTKVKLFALAVDSEGKYGSVFKGDYTTSEIAYSDIQVSIEFVEKDPGKFTVELTSTGGEPVKYIYWVGKEDSNIWTSNNYLGGSAESAQKYMFLNYDAARFADIAEAYPMVNGRVLMADLELGIPYVFVAVALDENGLTSKAALLRFTTRTVPLGEIVFAKNADGSDNPVWVNATPTVEFHRETFAPPTGMMSGEYSFTYDLSSDLTAYVMAGTDSYFGEQGAGTATLDIDRYILAIVEYADRKRDVNADFTGGDDWQWYHFCHGYALLGYGVIFPDEHISSCEYCSDYQANGKHKENMVVYTSGEPVVFRQPYAIGKDDTDKVYITFKDANGNFYEPYCIDVPDEYFTLSK